MMKVYSCRFLIEQLAYGIHTCCYMLHTYCFCTCFYFLTTIPQTELSTSALINYCLHVPHNAFEQLSGNEIIF